VQVSPRAVGRRREEVSPRASPPALSFTTGRLASSFAAGRAELHRCLAPSFTVEAALAAARTEPPAPMVAAGRPALLAGRRGTRQALPVLSHPPAPFVLAACHAALLAMDMLEEAVAGT